MTIRTVYVKAASKREINDRLAAGHKVVGSEYDPYGMQYVTLDANLPHGTVIKVWSKMIAGSPYAKAYGQWNAKLGRVK